MNKQLYRYIRLACLVVYIFPTSSQAQSIQHAALTYYSDTHNNAEMGLLYTYEHSPQAVIQEHGRGINEMQFQANAFHLLSKNSRLWGDVSYANACTRDVQGSENSDYDLVYPYVVSDQVGGNMKSETYIFNSGYAWHHQKWTFGGTIGYRALLAYRDIDPRPKNTVGHLKGSISAAYSVSSSHLWSIHLGGEKYKQESVISFVNPHKTVLLYHDTGLGTVYSRFTGNGSDTDISGQFYQFSMAYYPKTNNGFGGQTDWNIGKLEKKLNGFNELPLNDLAINNIQCVAYYTQQRLTHDWKIQGTWRTKLRKGTENIFGTEATTTYEKISSRQYYNQDIHSATIEGQYKWNKTRKNQYEISPKVSWISNKQIHKRDHRKLNYTWFRASMLAETHFAFKTSTLHLALGGQVQWATSTLCTFDIKNHPTLNRNHIMNAGSQQVLTLAIRYDTPWLIDHKQIYIKGSYKQGSYAQSLDTHRGSCGLGLIF